MASLTRFSQCLSPLPLFLSVVLLILTIEWALVGVDGRAIKIALTVNLPNGGSNITKYFDTDDEGLKTLGITKEQVESSLIYADADFKIRELIVGSRHIPLTIDIYNEPGSLVYTYITVNQSTWFVTRLNYTNVTLDDFKDDTTLEPMSISLDWSLPPPASPEMLNITLESKSLGTSIAVNNESLLMVHVNGTVPLGLFVTIVPYSGIYLRVLNPYTRRLTLSRYFNTMEYFADQDLITTLSNLKEGRVAMLTTYQDASGRIEPSSKEFLRSLGSFAAPHIHLRDCWAWVWEVGKGTLAEALVTNPNSIRSIPKPLELDVTFTPPEPSGRLCDTWPQEDIWTKRQHFCDVYESYGDLCFCQDPFQPPFNPKPATWREDIGIVILTGNRTRYLYRLLRQVLSQPGVTTDQLFVSVDGPDTETLKLLELFPLKYKVHQPEAKGSPRISRHLRFALFKAVELLNMDKFIILEDDLVLAPDFYSYMQQTSVILDEDLSVYGVSAYSHFSYHHTARDPTRLIRVHSLPSYGWMVRRYFLEETLPMWLPDFVATDWDYWMGSGLVRKGREIVIPEIPRTSHAGVHGAHISGFLTKRRFSNKPLSSDPNTLVNLTTINASFLEKELKDLLDRAQLLNVTNPYTFSFPNSSGEVGLVFVKMRTDENMLSFRVMADALKIWSQDTRDHHFGLWRFPYYQATLLIMGVPFSKYSKYYKKEYILFQANQETSNQMDDNFFDESYFFIPHSPLDYTHILDIPLDDSLVQHEGGSSYQHQLQEANTTITRYKKKKKKKNQETEDWVFDQSIFSLRKDHSDKRFVREFDSSATNQTQDSDVLYRNSTDQSVVSNVTSIMVFSKELLSNESETVTDKGKDLIGTDVASQIQTKHLEDSNQDQVSIDSASTVDQSTIDSASTADQLTIDSASTVDQLTIDSASTVDQLTIDSASTANQTSSDIVSTTDQTSVDSAFTVGQSSIDSASITNQTSIDSAYTTINSYPSTVPIKNVHPKEEKLIKESNPGKQGG